MFLWGQLSPKTLYNRIATQEYRLLKIQTPLPVKKAQTVTGALEQSHPCDLLSLAVCIFLICTVNSLWMKFPSYFANICILVKCFIHAKRLLFKTLTLSNKFDKYFVSMTSWKTFQEESMPECDYTVTGNTHGKKIIQHLH